MNRRQLLAALLTAPMTARQAVGAVLAVRPTTAYYELWVPPVPQALEFVEYSIPAFINGSSWTEQEIPLFGKGGGRDWERYRARRDRRWSGLHTQQATYQPQE